VFYVGPNAAKHRRTHSHTNITTRTQACIYDTYVNVKHQVFYVGPNAAKHRPTADAADNHGFDDERGDYLWLDICAYMWM